jgi:hypothetical protein
VDAELTMQLRTAQPARAATRWLAALVAVASTLFACSRAKQPRLSIEQQLMICRRHERLEISRAEAVKQLGLPPLKPEEAEGGIAGWLTYCRELPIRHRGNLGSPDTP